MTVAIAVLAVLGTDAARLHAEEEASMAENADPVAAIEAFIKDLQQLAHGLLEEGQSVPGWKLVPKRGSPHWIDEERALAFLRKDNKITKPHYIDEKLKSAAQVADWYKKNKIDISWDLLISSESTGVTFAPESDKREAIDLGTMPRALANIIGK